MLLGESVAPGVGDRDVFHRVRDVRVAEMILDRDDVWLFRAEVSAARMLEAVHVGLLGIDAGRLAVALHQAVQLEAIDALLALGEQRTGRGAALFDPGAHRLSFHFDQVVLATVRTLQPAEQETASVIVAELDQARLARAQAAVIDHSEEGAIARRLDDREQYLPNCGRSGATVYHMLWGLPPLR
jgi:hypothetical protein